jgi:AraC family transcriptional regulator, positive regulator of tynA and feaB
MHDETQGQEPVRGPGALATFSTDSVPAHQCAEYWHDSVLRRLDAKVHKEERKSFRARLVKLSGEGAELLQHSGDSLRAQRDAVRCRRDDCDDIVIDFVAAASGATLIHGGAKRLHAGDMVVVDCAQPAEISRGRHRVISLFIPRVRVSAVLDDPGALAGRLLPRHGMAVLLRNQMLATIDQAAHMLPEQRIMAVNAASEMALSILQMQGPSRANGEGAETGLYHAALALIARDCANPLLTPQQLVETMGCSRAALYRAFAREGASVAAAIWEARLAYAARLLQSPGATSLLISEVAFRSGFAEHSTFDRMFKRQYGLTPGDMRQGLGR